MLESRADAPPPRVIRAYPPHDATLHGQLESRATAGSTRTFLRFEHQTLSYAQFSKRVGAIKMPRYVAFADSLPVTATQRVQKFPLRGDASLRSRAADLGI